MIEVNWTASLRANMWYECSLVTTKVRDNKSSCFWVPSFFPFIKFFFSVLKSSVLAPPGPHFFLFFLWYHQSRTPKYSFKRPSCMMMERQESTMQATFCHHRHSSLNGLPTSAERASPLGPCRVPTNKPVASAWIWCRSWICDWSSRWQERS